PVIASPLDDDRRYLIDAVGLRALVIDGEVQRLDADLVAERGHLAYELLVLLTQFGSRQRLREDHELHRALQPLELLAGLLLVAPVEDCHVENYTVVSRPLSAARGNIARRGVRRSVVLPDLLCQVVGLACLGDERQLSLEPVRVLFLAFEHLLEELAGPIVSEAAGQLDAVVEPLDGRLLDLEVQPELLGHRLADIDLAQALQVGHALEIQDALNQPVRVAHLAERLLTNLLPETLVTPVLTHPCVDEV